MKIRTYLLASVSIVALAGSAAAADLPVKARSFYSPEPVSNWTGFYVGAHAGIARHAWEFTDLDDWTGNTIGTFWASSKNGFIAGAQIGYNWQSGSMVYGVEADWSWLSGDASQTFEGSSYGASTSVDWLATFRLRTGLAYGNSLVYITGGLAIANVNNAWGPGYVGAFGRDFVSEDTRTGWVAGVGIEHMFTPNWTFKAEALYVDLGAETATASFAGLTYSSEFRNELVIGRVGFNYRW
jgi:outer membrane immunogenic protein